MIVAGTPPMKMKPDFEDERSEKGRVWKECRVMQTVLELVSPIVADNDSDVLGCALPVRGIENLGDFVHLSSRCSW
jgi:hypothetical protein